jgi:5'-phosphate synthase pdxT subunit
MKAGVLALQGAFREHREVLDGLGVETLEVRSPEHLAGIDVLVMPGGESTTMGMLLASSGLLEPIAARLRDSMPVFGTCAGLILLADRVLDGRPDQVSFGLLHAAVRRNAYGTQLASFEADLDVAGLAGGVFPGVFIRAPVIEEVGDDVEVLARHDGHAILVRQGRIWAATFHPELSGDLRIHERFISEVTR